MDIGSRNPWPAGALSNFTAYRFTIDAVCCASMEGFLQSLKFDELSVQRFVCALTGIQAKKHGSTRDAVWKNHQTLWWKGITYPRCGPEYRALITRAYDALGENPYFRKALLATANEPLTHSVGKSDPADTCLTEREFCDQLLRLRAKFSP